jgi:hypothetical protein
MLYDPGSALTHVDISLMLPLSWSLSPCVGALRDFAQHRDGRLVTYVSLDFFSINFVRVFENWCVCRGCGVTLYDNSLPMSLLSQRRFIYQHMITVLMAAAADLCTYSTYVRVAIDNTTFAVDSMDVVFHLYFLDSQTRSDLI